MPDDEDFGMDDVIRSHGYEPRTTDLCTLMAAPVSMGLAVADYMENPDA